MPLSGAPPLWCRTGQGIAATANNGMYLGGEASVVVNPLKERVGVQQNLHGLLLPLKGGKELVGKGRVKIRRNPYLAFGAAWEMLGGLCREGRQRASGWPALSAAGRPQAGAFSCDFTPTVGACPVVVQGGWEPGRRVLAHVCMCVAGGADPSPCGAYGASRASHLCVALVAHSASDLAGSAMLPG